MKNIKNKIRILFFIISAFILPTSGFAETIGVFYDPTIGQIKFAAEDIKTELEANGYVVEMKLLSTLNTAYTNKKVVIALTSNSAVTAVLTSQGGTIPTGLGVQAYGLRTVSNTQKSYWVLGGDNNGAMYGGLQMAENIRFEKLNGTYNDIVSPSILNRGIKLNLPWDKASGTYGIKNKGTYDGTSSQLAIKDVWDMTFWTSWFDEMARNRYNIVSLWSCNPFTSLVVVPGYEDCSIQNVTYLDGTVKTMTITQKIKYWQDVMAYAHSRGFEFLFFNWNVFTYGATGKYGIKDGLSGETSSVTRDYMYKAMIELLKTYPDLDGFGLSIGENKGTEDFVWNTYGKAMFDYAKVNTQRKLKFIHRLHYGDFDKMVTQFAPIRTLSNVSFDISVKHSQAHMYSTPSPNWWPEELQDIRNNNLKTWLTVRNDDFFYLTWGDPSFARTYINGMIGLGSIFKGFYMGCDGYNPTRTFLYKDNTMNGQLEVVRQQYMMMIWGRLTYNQNTSDNIFKNYMGNKYPSVNKTDLFNAWSKSSSGVQRANEIIQGDYEMDYKWWPEACQREADPAKNLEAFVTVSDFAQATVAPGSLIGTIANSASGNLNGKKSSYALADEIEVDALAALSIVNAMSAPSNTELGVAINNIKALSYLSLYYAYKIRGATYLAVGVSKKAEKIAALGNAYCWWIKYTSLMDGMYKGMDMQRSSSLPNWHTHDLRVLKEYNDNGGTGKPNCVTIAVASVSLSGCPAVSILQNDTSQLAANVLPTNADNKVVTWSSSDTAVATVSSTGLVTAKKAGSTKITVTTVDGNKIDVCDLVVAVSTPAQTPFGGVNRKIPGFIEGEHYDEGIEGFAFHDDATKQGVLTFRPKTMVDVVNKTTASGGRAVGFTLNGEWLEYRVDATMGTYDISFSYFCNNSNAGDLKVSLGGTLLTTITSIVAQTSLSVLAKTTVKGVDIAGGNNIPLRLEVINGARFDIDAIEFIPSTTTVKISSDKTADSESVDNGFRVYPNPVSDILNLEFADATSSKQIKVFNANGQLVYSSQTTKGTATIDVKTLNLIGVVMIQVVEGSSVYKNKVIIK